MDSVNFRWKFTLSPYPAALLELAGFVEARDSRLREATVRFAAHSEPVADLLPEEREALEEYVKALAES
ncbi:MAG TPA: hypothetical protein VKA46_34680 [Gemmataceae bacterium]|nr:hypothetical protein [Gemmataceae bacterium]